MTALTLLRCGNICSCMSAHAANCLKVGDEYKLLTFIGRLTHQKGSDSLAAGAGLILAKNKFAQVPLTNSAATSERYVTYQI